MTAARPRSTTETLAAASIALITWFALGLQLWLLAELLDNWPLAIANFFGYFTVLTNTLMAAILTIPLLGLPGSAWCASPGVRAAVAVYIVIVGVVYTVILQELWNPTGAQAVADDLLHKIGPMAYTLFWLVYGDKRSLGWSAIPRWLIYPLAYFGIALARGLATDWYPYPFMNASTLGLARVLLNAVGLTLVMAFASALLIGGSRAFAGPRPGRAGLRT